MADDMYDEAAPPASEDASVANDSNDTKGDTKDKKDDNKGEDTEDQMSLVPTNFFKEEPKPGMREMVEVVEVYDGEVSIRCVYGDKDDESKKEESEEGMETEPASMAEEEDSMMA